MKLDQSGKRKRTERNKASRKAKLDRQLRKAEKSREILIEQLEKRSVKIAKYLSFSRTKLRIALAEIKKFPRNKPGILALSWKRFLRKPDLAQIAKNVLGIEKFKEIYLRHVGKKYKENKGS